MRLVKALAALSAFVAFPIHAQQQPEPSNTVPATTTTAQEQPKAIPASTPARPMPSPTAVAPAAAPLDSTVHRHLGGFIRPDLGFGYLTLSEPSGTSLGDMTLSGVAGLAGIAFGGAVTENVILGGHIFDAVALNPNVSFSSGGSSSTSNTQLTLWGIGPEVTVYNADNMFLSATLGITRQILSVNGRDSSSDWGFGGRIGAGKEWWVSDHWGLGLVGHVSYANNGDGPQTISTWAFGLAFSATYN